MTGESEPTTLQPTTQAPLTFLTELAPLPLVGPTEAARSLGLERHSLACYRSLGVGPPYYKLGRWIRYLRTDLHRWQHLRGQSMVAGEHPLRTEHAYPGGLLETGMAAAFLTLSPGWLVFCRFEHVGPPYRRLGRRFYYSVDELLGWVEEQRIAA